MCINSVIRTRVGTDHAANAFFLIELYFIVLDIQCVGRTYVDALRFLTMTTDIVLELVIEFFTPNAYS